MLNAFCLTVNEERSQLSSILISTYDWGRSAVCVARLCVHSFYDWSFYIAVINKKRSRTMRELKTKKKCYSGAEIPNKNRNKTRTKRQKKNNAKKNRERQPIRRHPFVTQIQTYTFAVPSHMYSRWQCNNIHNNIKYEILPLTITIPKIS